MVFSLLVSAEADNGNDLAPGEARELMLFVPARSKDEAITQALMALADRCWKRGEIREVQRLLGFPKAITNPLFRDAARRAFAGERSVLISS